MIRLLKMKKIFTASLLLIFPFTFVPFGSISVEALNPLAEKIIALDAGHGGTELGATYPANMGTDADIYEKDVNLAAVYALKEKLEDPSVGANVVLTRKCDETISRRKDRVDIALEECKSLYGKKCDALISIHHNGSTDSTYDGLLVIYNEKQDLALANALHDALWTGLTHNPNGYVDEGLDKGGYGMTVYGNLVSVITEAYYITNDWEAEQYLAGTETLVCDSNGDSIDDYPVLIEDRINEEVDALYQGLIDYFSSSSGNGGGKPDKCSPWPECKK